VEERSGEPVQNWIDHSQILIFFEDDMLRGLIIYHTQTGNTRLMAETIADSMNKEGIKTKCQSVSDTSVDDLLAANAIVVGSPTYYGHMAAPMTLLFDNSVSIHGKLKGKIGAAFSSSANIGGGNETTVLNIIHSLLIHGMIVPGDFEGDHFGPVSIGTPDDRVLDECKRRGRIVAELTKRIFP